MTNNTPIPPHVDFGPLTHLFGTWEGDKGKDIAPELDGKEENPYYETITFTPVGDVENGKSQYLVIVRYLQVVRRKSNNNVFHDETGYWLWDAKNNTVMHSLTIPRGVCVLAGGEVSNLTSSSVEFNVSAKADSPDWGIVQSPFMRDKAKTMEFIHQLKISGNKMEYKETTKLNIYGNNFDHTDENILTRVDV